MTTQPSREDTPKWIKVSERLPTREDTDENGECWWANGRDVWLGFIGGLALKQYLELNGATHWLQKPRQEPPAPPEDT